MYAAIYMSTLTLQELIDLDEVLVGTRGIKLITTIIRACNSCLQCSVLVYSFARFNHMNNTNVIVSSNVTPYYAAIFAPFSSIINKKLNRTLNQGGKINDTRYFFFVERGSHARTQFN